MTKPINFAKSFRAEAEKRKQAMMRQAQKTILDGDKIRNRLASMKKEDQQKKEE